MLGLRYGTVMVVPYRPEWAQAFLEERGRLQQALQGIPSQIEHIGGTAVPGLSAKPILDISVGLSAVVPLDTILTALARLDYEYRGDAGEQGGHIFVRESAPLIRTHHVHVVELDGPQWKAYLELRDFLRWSEAAGARRLMNEFFFSAPQLKRSPLGGGNVGAQPASDGRHEDASN